MIFCQRKVLVVLSLSVPLLVSGSARGAITQINTSPSNANLPLGQSSAVRLTWSVVSNLAGNVTISSSQGTFLTPGGKVLGKVDKVLTRPLSGPAPKTARFSESLRVPTKVIYQAHKQGFNKFIYRRRFTDGTAASGEINFYVTSPRAASFGITRLALLFDDQTPLRIVEQNASFKARAEITFAGSGLLKAVWEIAAPTSTAGQANFRPLKMLRQYMPGDTVTLASPLLPTDISGIYLIRLRISQPETAFELPVIRYSVGKTRQTEVNDATNQ